MPRSRYGRPSNRAAAATSPASRAVRTRLLDTTAQSTACRATTANRTSRRRHHSPSSSRSPARPRPKRKLNPSTTAFAASRSPRTVSRNSPASSRKQFRRRPQDDDVIRPGGVQQLGPVGRRRQQRLQPLRREQGDRVRVERDGHRGPADLVGRRSAAGRSGRRGRGGRRRNCRRPPPRRGKRRAASSAAVRRNGGHATCLPVRVRAAGRSPHA